MTEQLRILLIDDEVHSLHSMRMALEDEFEIAMAESAADAMAILDDTDIHIIFCDQRMPEKTGVEFLDEVRERFPDIIRIVITGYTDPNDMIDAINRAGIYQFVTKPWHPDQLMMTAKNAAQLYTVTEEHARLSLEMRYLTANANKKLKSRQKALQNGFGFENIVCTPSSSMNEIIRQAQEYAAFDIPMLITGEISVGKGRLARAVHYTSLRAEQNFVAFNFTGVKTDEFAREFYGYRRGAIAGTSSGRMGLLQKADRGTLMLENIDRAPLHVQEQLMRVFEYKSYTPIGAVEANSTDLRVIATSTESLEQLVADGKFMAALYHYLAVGVVDIAPMRQRPNDIALLALHYLHEAAAQHGKAAVGFDELALEFLENYNWPGNIGELQNEVIRMLIKARSETLGAELISRHILQAERHDDADTGIRNDMLFEGTLKERIETIEARILRETLTRLKWNKSRAANELGLSRVGLRAKLDRYGIDNAERQINKE